MTLALVVALLPVALLIGFGHGLRRMAFLSEGFWPQAERLAYYVLLPALFFDSLAMAKLGDLPVKALAGVLLLSIAVCAVLLVAGRRLVSGDDSAFTSVFQGGIRFNNFIGVTAISSLFGAQGLALAAIANAVIVPTVNVLCVLVFARYGSVRPSPMRLARQLALNPLVLACAGGIAMQSLGLALPAGPELALHALGQASLPLGLLCVGAALDLHAAKGAMQPMLAASLAKFIIMPAVTAVACISLGLHGAALVTALLFQSLPTASSSYIMARQLGGDAPLMAAITAFQTVLAGLVLPLILPILIRWAGG